MQLQLNSSSIFEEHLSPIGIFDSGVGGLTVLQEVYRQLPQESILYFGDTARVPYGNRQPEEIIQFAEEILHWMENQGVKMAIMACNTSSALALDAVRQYFKFPILGVILPGSRQAANIGKNIGVIATPATVTSNAYQQAILESANFAMDNPAIAVHQVPCPEFVPLIEQNRIFEPHTREIAQKYLAPLIQAEIDTLIYGCTHYPHLEPVLRDLVPSHVQFVNPAVHVVEAAHQELKSLGLLNPSPTPITKFVVSGNPEQFSKLSRQWLGFYPQVEQIQIAQLSRKSQNEKI